MRNLQNLFKLTLLLSFMLLIVQGCNEGDMKGVSEDLSNSLSTKMPDNYGWNYMEIDEADIPELCNEETVCLIAGQHDYVGSVTVGNDADGNLFVTYQTIDGYKLTEIHLAVAASEEGIPQNNPGNPQVGHFAYNMEFQGDYPTTHTIKITDPDLDGNGCAIIAAHAVVSGMDGNQTAWGGPCEDGEYTEGAMEFTPGKNGSWARYFQYCEGFNCEKKVDFTFAWEDLLDERNDADYNDFITQATMLKTSESLTIMFNATARGAAYDHEFKFLIPQAGITSIDGADAVDDDGGGNWIVTVFSSTKTALPPENLDPNPPTANTVDRGTSCIITPYAKDTITIHIDNTFTFNEDQPFDPFITVYPSQKAGVGDHYDLHIWEWTGTDTWTDGEDNEYPNGLIIPSDWKWPLERVPITDAYEDFMPIASWNTNWADNLSDPTKVFDLPECP